MDIPNYLIDLLKNEYPNDYEKILDGYREKRKESFRINNLKASKEEIEVFLKTNKINYERWPYLEGVYIIDDSTPLKKSNYYLEGKIYFQNLSSILPPLYLDLVPKTDLLDMAASPGSKTSLIASLMNNDINITACEIDKIRMERLKYNMDKLGVKNINFLLQDASKLDDYFRFDNILLDAPCSGSGTLNIFDQSFNKFSLKLVNNSKNLQKKLLRKALMILKPNQTLIYSTCSILKEENEEVIKEFINNPNYSLVPLEIKESPELVLLPTTISGTLCIKPNKYYEGFFITKIKKLK